MLIDKLYLPKIIDDLAKFNGRKKCYVPYSSVIKDSSPARVRELHLLAELQTEWESLQKAYPGNINFIKCFDKHYKQILWPDDRIFCAVPAITSCYDELWLPPSQVVSRFNRVFYEQLRPLSNQGFDEFQAMVQDKISRAYESTKILKQIWQTVSKFIDYQNQHYMLAEHHYPKIIASQPIKTNPLIINADWVKNGKLLVKTIRAVQHHWNQTSDYSQDQILGWLVFSGIVYGGINEV